MLASVCLAACSGPTDQPTMVKDLRVLGVSFGPPEVMMRACTPRVFQAIIASTAPDAGVSLDPAIKEKLAGAAGVPLDYTVLIVDPAGNGRALQYELRACVSDGDRTCSDPGGFVRLGDGVTTAGEFKQSLTLGSLLLDSGDPLLLAVLNHDQYKGLGGIRIPVVIKLTAADTGEVVYAQKLMVFQCQLFPTMKQNVQPKLPGVNLEGSPWTADEVRELKGKGPFAIDPDDFADRQETYVVPSLTFKPITIGEAWKIARFTTEGQVSPYETGGAALSGELERHHADWEPDTSLKTPQDVRFWFVVRDGRGGESWLTRQAHWAP